MRSNCPLWHYGKHLVVLLLCPLFMGFLGRLRVLLIETTLTDLFWARLISRRRDWLPLLFNFVFTHRLVKSLFYELTWIPLVSQLIVNFVIILYYVASLRTREIDQTGAIAVKISVFDLFQMLYTTVLHANQSLGRRLSYSIYSFFVLEDGHIHLLLFIVVLIDCLIKSFITCTFPLFY